MAFTDITPQFRELVSKATIPNASRRRSAKASQKSAEGKEGVQVLLNKEYVQEAYNIVGHKIRLISITLEPCF